MERFRIESEVVTLGGIEAVPVHLGVDLVCEQVAGGEEELELEQVRDFCRGTISSYKAPRALVKVDQIKRTPAAKADYVWAKKEATSRLAK